MALLQITSPLSPPIPRSTILLSSLRVGGSIFSVPAKNGRRRIKRIASVSAMADPGISYKMNLNEYMVALEKPLGIRFALSVDGKIFVHSLKKGGNAERSRIIMVGDAVKKASKVSGGFMQIEDFNDTREMLMDTSGSISLVLERPVSPYPIQELYVNGDSHNLFNRGRTSFTTWNKHVLASNLESSSEGNGSSGSGFAIFSPKFLKSQGWMVLSSDQSESYDSQLHKNSGSLAKRMNEIVGIFTEENIDDAEWAFGSFPLEEYIKALDRAKGELYYNHSLGMQYSKVTEQIYVGSCIQSENDVQKLSNMGITAILNFQSESERSNWGINSELINNSCREHNILMVNYPVREVDSTDLRKKLPFCVGLLLRLLRKNHRIYVTCTTGFDRSPASVIAYLHWIQDTELHAAHNFVTALHSCRPDRYQYKFIIGGHWRHSTSLPTETDEHGNINNVIRIGDVARVRPAPSQLHIKDPTVVKVIERRLTEDERFLLAFAARRIAFAICPIKLAPK